MWWLEPAQAALPSHAPLEPVDLLDQRVLLALRRSREPTGALPCSTRKDGHTEAAACCIRGWKRGSHSAPCGRAARRTQRTQPWASYECVGGAPFLADFSPSNSAFFSRRSWSILCARRCASMRALQEAAVAGACAGACAQARTTRARHRQVWAHNSALTRSGDAGGPPRAGRAVAGRGAPLDRPYWHGDKWRQKAPPLVHRQNGVCSYYAITRPRLSLQISKPSTTTQHTSHPPAPVGRTHSKPLARRLEGPRYCSASGLA